MFCQQSADTDTKLPKILQQPKQYMIKVMT